MGTEKDHTRGQHPSFATPLWLSSLFPSPFLVSPPFPATPPPSSSWLGLKHRLLPAATRCPHPRRAALQPGAVASVHHEAPVLCQQLPGGFNAGLTSEGPEDRFGPRLGGQPEGLGVQKYWGQRVRGLALSECVLLYWGGWGGGEMKRSSLWCSCKTNPETGPQQTRDRPIWVARLLWGL